MQSSQQIAGTEQVTNTFKMAAYRLLDNEHQ